MKNSKYTFYQLIQDYNIIIPIVQRDYAQGRTDDKAREVRKNLLQAIIFSLNSMKELDFNFVYGNVEQQENENLFYPVDGQQRLTTLYLLHWYLAVCNGDETVTKYNSMKKFTYKTRNSATEFFSLLRKSNEDLYKIIRSKATGLRSEIENQSWFQAEWNSDPTVDSVLTMLEAFNANKNMKEKALEYYKKLTIEACPIVFTMVKEEGGDGEKLAAANYIRMNARGKSLEPFENLKAMIDGMDDSDKEKIITNYDTKYIDMLFEQATGSIVEKTKSINEKSFNFCKNIYNIMQRVIDQESYVKMKDSDYISTIFEISKNANPTFNKNMYLSLLDDYWQYCYDNYKKDEKIMISPIFEISKDGFSVVEKPAKRAMAEVIYIYHYRCKHSTVPSVEKVALYIYVLENLNFEMWEKYALTIYVFADAMSKCQDIYHYFVNTQENIEDILQNVNLLDINVRIKEQRIKADIIMKNNISDQYYFSAYEKKARNRKIQYLLYISGYWCGTGNFNSLKKYLTLADKWFMSDSNDLIWRKYYAVAKNCEEIAGCLKLKAYDVINKESSDNMHIWSNSYYYWNDKNDKEEKLMLKIILRAYENADKIAQILHNLPANTAYDDCWLKYAVKYNHVELLNTKLKSTDNGSVNLVNENVYSKEAKKFMIYVLELEKKAKWGLHKFSKNVSYTHSFQQQKTYVGNSGKKFQYEYSNYNMTVKKEVKIGNVIGIPKDKELCAYTFDNTTSTYTVYHYNEMTPAYFETYNVVLATEIGDMDTSCENERETLENYSLQDCVDIMHDSINWKKQSGNSHTWKGYTIVVPCNALVKVGQYII